VKKLLFLLLGGLLVSSCAPSTPQTRIQQNPGLFASLPPKDQQLVQQGTLAKGMSRDAVLLAWGPPTQRFEGLTEGKHSERWDYASSYPVYTQQFYGGFYGGYGRRGRYGYPIYGFAPEVTYVPYRSATVWFVNQRVDAWERSR
jgi:outer membrane protein assembly factor BamE (lipoprotein component of BamABCDE complex)